MDFLGLRNLDVISDCLELIKDTKGVELDIDAIELDDQPTFELLKRGETIGVFQLESSPMRALIRSLAPTRSTMSPPWSPSIGPARWRRTCTTTTPTARTGESRWSSSTPTPRSCSATPTA